MGFIQMDVIIREQFSKFFSLLTEKYGLENPELYMTSIHCNFGGNSKRLCKNENCGICFNKSFASYSKASQWSLSNSVSPRDVFKSSSKSYYFTCEICQHEFSKSLNSTSQGVWCPYCASQKLCDSNKCDMCYKKSFASHYRSEWWSALNIVTPRSVFMNTLSKYQFTCDICCHNFSSTLNNIVKGNWCPYCAGKICKMKDCSICFGKSFASHPMSQYWSDENKFHPWEVASKTHDKYKFVCGRCRHAFVASLSHISNGEWCPYCSVPPKQVCDSDACISCFDKSFASHPKAKYWSDSNTTTPRSVLKSSGLKYRFDCDECTSTFTSVLYSVVAGNWCPSCKNKTEKKIHLFLAPKYKDLIHQPTFEWCRNPDTGRYLPFDFAIPSLRCIIECDGEQHFRQVWNWASPEEQKKRDLYKIRMAVKNGYTVIRLLQKDVWHDNINWEEMLINGITTRPQGVVLVGDYNNHFDDINMLSYLKGNENIVD